jgi:hypothetical protein
MLRSNPFLPYNTKEYFSYLGNTEVFSHFTTAVVPEASSLAPLFIKSPLAKPIIS